MAKEPSKQVQWQRKQRSLGLCHLCSQPAVEGATSCRVHLEARRERSRQSYRRAHGIPDDAPLIKSGRPRKGE